MLQKKLFLAIFLIVFLISGCAKDNEQKSQSKVFSNNKGVVVYQNNKIHGFKIAPNGKKMLIVIENAFVLFDLEKMKPILKIPENGLTSTPTNIFWSPDSHMATVIFTGNVNRMIFVDFTKHGLLYDLYAKGLLDLSWEDSRNLLYKAAGETEALFKMPVFAKEASLLTALKPGEEKTTKFLLVNWFQGFILKKDDVFYAVNLKNLEQPKKIADLNFRSNKGLLTRDVIIDDKNENGILLRKYGFISLRGKTFVLNNDLVFINAKGDMLTLTGKKGKMLSGGIFIHKEDNSIAIFDLHDKKERKAPGNWQNYQVKLQSDYLSDKKIIFLNESALKSGRSVKQIKAYVIK